MAIAVSAGAFALVPFVGLGRATGVVRQQVECTIAVADDAYSTPQDTPLVVADPGVVANDNICGTDGLVISQTQPSHGTLTDFDDSGGGFTYTPNPGFSGTDSFTYTLEDVTDSPTGTVTITVVAPTTTTTTTTTTVAPAPPLVAAQAVTAAPVFTG